MNTETISLEVAIEVVLRNGPTFETIAGLCKMAVEAEREKVVDWMVQRCYATGHGDTVEDLLEELEWQVRESEREACAKVCEGYDNGRHANMADLCAAAIRARSNA